MSRTTVDCKPLKPPREPESSQLFSRYMRLTMPAGALDALLRPVLKIHAQRSDETANPLRVGFLLFAGDHAVARLHGVSAYPPEVTPQMVANIATGGAAISRLAARRNAPMIVCDVGVAEGFNEILSVQPCAGIKLERANLHHRFPSDGFAMGARDITTTSALTPEAHAWCWDAGARCVDLMLQDEPCDVIALGEMGIGNTTPASVLAALITGLSAQTCAGRGTGVDDEGLARKTSVIAKAVQRASESVSTHPRGSMSWAQAILQDAGGAELSALAGAAWRAAERGVMVLLDGLIVTAAVAPLAVADKVFAQWLLASHESAEQVHAELMTHMGLTPFLRLGLRLGEGSGAALAAGLLQDADVLLRTMATFESAGVSSR